MATFNMTCGCGEQMSVEAGSREEAIGMLKAGMTQEAVDAHLAQHHANDPIKPTLAQVHASIEQSLVAV